MLYIATELDAGAAFSYCRKYRYSLWRIWDNNLRKVMFIGLNPSTANELVDDPTIRRCIGFARSWGYGGLYVVNLFAYRATDPKRLRKVANPVGHENDKWLLETASQVEIIVAAWGNKGAYLNRDCEVRKMLPNLYCLGVTKPGQPRHPLYLRKDLLPILMTAAI